MSLLHEFVALATSKVPSLLHGPEFLSEFLRKKRAEPFERDNVHELDVSFIWETSNGPAIVLECRRNPILPMDIPAYVIVSRLLDEREAIVYRILASLVRPCGQEAMVRSIMVRSTKWELERFSFTQVSASKSITSC